MKERLIGAWCDLVYHDTPDKTIHVYFSFSGGVVEDENGIEQDEYGIPDDTIFYYCHEGLDELKRFTIYEPTYEWTVSNVVTVNEGELLQLKE